MIHFTTFVGIDQTGATDPKGTPKPLPVALVYKTSDHWKLHFSKAQSQLEIASVTREELLKLLHAFPHPGRDLSRTALIMDSVFGLPASQWPIKKTGSEGLFELFQRAQQFEYKKKSYGRDTAEMFFAQFLKSNRTKKLPTRLCEDQSGANSVFLTKPFQRNIGCGTFRIWKDLGDAPEKWFQIWGFDEPESHVQDGPWIFEAYPSLFWKKILGMPTRNAKHLVRYLKTQSPFELKIESKQFSLLLEDPDLCDSVVLALSAMILQEHGNEIWQIPKAPHLDKEGWILGL